jgi:hypothetical protein
MVCGWFVAVVCLLELLLWALRKLSVQQIEVLMGWDTPHTDFVSGLISVQLCGALRCSPILLPVQDLLQ